MAHGREQKTIAKNTIFLYMRMIVVMFVSLYTSRVVLDKLGVEDYGIYNIVGSVVISFIFIKNALQSASQRFLSYSKGSGEGNVSRVFSMSMNVHILIMFIVCILLETVGLWFFSNVIKIPEGRMSAALVVYQFSIFTFCCNLIQVPFLSSIISNERMSFYAIISIVEVLMKLVIVFALTLVDDIDKLILYGGLMLLVSVLCMLLAMIYCKVKLTNDCRYIWTTDKSLFKSFLSFASWNLIGGVSSVATTEGPNYFMNYYLGVNVNAAMGIAKQVSGAVYGFSANFQTAFNPQIVKSYASGDYKYFFDLIFRTSKLSYFLIFIIALPLIVCCHEIMSLWLTIVPEYAEIFCILILISQIVSSISSPFWMSAHAIGDIKNYQLVLVLFNLSVLPVSWIVLYLNFSPSYIIAYQIVLNLGILLYRIYYLQNRVDFPTKDYVTDVLLRCILLVSLISIPATILIHQLLPKNIWGLLITTFVSVIVVSSSFIIVGLNNTERNAIKQIVSNKVIRKI